MSASNQYRVILFDVGGTLLDVKDDPQRVAFDSIEQRGAMTFAAFSLGIERAVSEWHETDGRPEREDLPETWVQHYRRALTLAGFDGDVGRTAQMLEDNFLTDGWAVFPDVRDALEELVSLGFRLGVVSNWPATLETTLGRVSLRGFFSAIVASATVGFAKPHPRPFLCAAEQLGVEPRCALYVGDSVSMDVRGAKAADMDALLLDRVGAHETEARRIQSLAELPDLVRY